MISKEEKEELIISLQKAANKQQFNVQNMIIFGVLAFLAQFVFNQFAGDGQKSDKILIVQESMKQEIKSLSRELSLFRESAEKDDRRNVENLQKQIDSLKLDNQECTKLLASLRDRLHDLESTVEHIQ